MVLRGYGVEKEYRSLTIPWFRVFSVWPISYTGNIGKVVYEVQMGVIYQSMAALFIPHDLVIKPEGPGKGSGRKDQDKDD